MWTILSDIRKKRSKGVIEYHENHICHIQCHAAVFRADVRTDKAVGADTAGISAAGKPGIILDDNVRRPAELHQVFGDTAAFRSADSVDSAECKEAQCDDSPHYRGSRRTEQQGHRRGAPEFPERDTDLAPAVGSRFPFPVIS